MIGSIEIDGDPIALADVFASVTLRHGRAAVDDEPLGSTATLSLLNVDAIFTRDFRVGRELAIDVYGPTTNLAINGGVETNLDGWSPWAPGGVPQQTLTRTTEGARFGDYALLVTALGSGPAWAAIYANAALTARHPVTAGLPYVLSAYFETVVGDGSRPLSLEVDWYGASGFLGFAYTTAVVPRSRRLVLPAVAPPGATGAVLWVGGENGAAGDAYRVDGLQFEQSERPTPYVETDGAPASRLAGIPRFRGRITDAALNQDDPDEPALAILAVSTLARISGRKVGAVAWPAESWSSRVARAFTEAGASSELVLEVGTSDPALAARPADETTLADVLQELAETVSSAIADLPDGNVLVQAVTSRQGSSPIALDPELVVLAPEWAQSDDVANVVRVEWDGGTVELSDAGSIALYDERAPLTIQTLLANVSDANARAALELNRRSRPDWRLDQAELLTSSKVDFWDGPTGPPAAILDVQDLDVELGIGSAVLIDDLPAASPRELHIGMLEGWTDRIEAIAGELEWTMELALSPQRLSGYGLAWADVPSAISWDDADPSISWDEPEQLLA